MTIRHVPSLPAATVLKALAALGFVQTHQSGSHVRLHHPDGRAVTIPDHGHHDLKTGTLHNILRQAHLTTPEFLATLA